MIRFSLILALFALPVSADTLRVMSFNIWGGGANEAKGIEETVAAIRAAGADVVGLQETRLESDPCTAEACPAVGDSAAPAIAKALGWYVHDQTAVNSALWANAVISRYPIGAATPNDLGVPLEVNGKTVWIFNIHHDDEPYQPYQLLDIPYGPAPFIKTEAEAVRFATDTRGPAMDLLFDDMGVVEGAAAIFVTGDFNEPSVLDWTAAAVTAGQQPVVVKWPTTERLIEGGFIDTYRAVHPDPVAKPAYTWTPRYDEAAKDDHPDRIDFVFVMGPQVKITAAAIVGEDGLREDGLRKNGLRKNGLRKNGLRRDIKVMPWPSDHRAVVAEVAF